MIEIYYHPIYTSGISKSSNFPRDRYQLIYDSLSNDKYSDNVHFITSEKIKIEHLYRAHEKEYVNNFINDKLSKSQKRKIGLRPWTSKIVDRTLFITGGSLQALQSTIKNGISANLAGGTHHAHYDFGSGYCIFNDLAVCAYYCKTHYKNHQNILIIDLDVHQGDGTASILKKENSVFTFSMHCETNFPLIKKKSDLDVSLEKGIKDDKYLDILSSNLKLLEKVKTDIVFFQAGVDSLDTDALGHMKLSHQGLKKRNAMILEFCKNRNYPILVFMGGGYSKPIDDTVKAFKQLFLQCSVYSW